MKHSVKRSATSLRVDTSRLRGIPYSPWAVGGWGTESVASSATLPAHPCMGFFFFFVGAGS